jgi:intracellular multiplication protein IcmC
MSSQHSLKGPLINFLVATALIYSPQMFATLMLTSFGYSSPLQYGGDIPGWADAGGKALIGLVQVIGVIAFIRGWLYIARLAGQGGQPGTFGKGLTHIIGGILAINIIGTKEVLFGTFGFS